MPHAALRTLLPIAGWSDKQAEDVSFTGGMDPVLPTPFRIGQAGAATLAATGVASAELWKLRTGRRQHVTVDVRQATASLRSGHYMRLGDGNISTARLASDTAAALLESRASTTANRLSRLALSGDFLTF